MKVYKYRITNTLDPEERVEDAALAKAMHDVFGDRLEIVAEGEADFGRDKMFIDPLKNIAMQYGMRFVSVGRQVVTFSSVGHWLTPLAMTLSDCVLYNPSFKSWSRMPEVSGALRSLASLVAKSCQYENAIIDCAMIDGKPGVIEVNLFSVGNSRLYACCPYRIAAALHSEITTAENMAE